MLLKEGSVVKITGPYTEQINAAFQQRSVRRSHCRNSKNACCSPSRWCIGKWKRDWERLQETGEKATSSSHPQQCWDYIWAWGGKSLRTGLQMYPFPLDRQGRQAWTSPGISWKSPFLMGMGQRCDCWAWPAHKVTLFSLLCALCNFLRRLQMLLCHPSCSVPVLWLLCSSYSRGHTQEGVTVMEPEMSMFNPFL